MENLFQGDSPLLQTLGRWGAKIYSNRELIQMEIHLLLSAIFPIYIGSHASLRRPYSAAAPPKPKKNDEDEEEVEEERAFEGLQPSDAILFPIGAGVILGGLYLIIKWLEDPAILNKIMGWYFSGLGIFGVGKLAADLLNVGTTFIFPNVWSSGNTTYHVEPLLSQQVTGRVKRSKTLVTRTNPDTKSNPLPGFLSNINFSPTITATIWNVRSAFKDHWVFTSYIHSILSFKTNIKLNDVIGFFIGVSTIAVYNFKGKPWYLTNVLGFGFCYGTLQLMSPTTFWTGTLVLAGLFFYDITMVFYTPLMVTVATKLDVPIKLLFPGPKHMSMLGLGDVVLPGIMMALALRFDLYLHYLKQQKAVKKSDGLDTEEKEVVDKVEYVEATGNWGERFWTSSKGDGERTIADGARFSKIYFKASIVGYLAAMLVTLAIMKIFKHAQPALLYLVPGVLISLWGTALVRGEFNLMWEYNEDQVSPSDKEKENKSVEAKDGGKTLTAKQGFIGNGDSSSEVFVFKGIGDSEEKKEKEKVEKERGVKERKEREKRDIIRITLSAPIKK